MVQAGDKFIIRFPKGMRARIAAIAKENYRSMNSEMVLALKRWLEQTQSTVTEKMSK